MRRIPQLILIALVLLGGCSKSATDPGGGGTPPLPPSLVATQPAPWATGVLYDAEIWGQFDRSLSRTTVNTKSVFLKLDGQRIPVTVAYDTVTRRIALHPTVTLELLRTYTVEFTSAVLGSDGTPLPEGVFFQFTTNSLRRPSYDYPVSGALEGPLVTLGWGGTQGPLNELFYEVYASTDSLEVVQRTAPMLQRSVFTRLVPSASWPQGQRVFWAVTTENLVTHERLPGTVQSFQVMDASVPVQTITVNVRDWGSNDIRNRNTQYCSRNTIPVGPGFNGGIHWDYNRLPADARVVSVTMAGYLTDLEAGRFNGIKPVTVWMSQNDWQNCSMIAPGPPYNELSGLLATATEASPTRLEFTSPRLGAFVEAQARRRTLVTGLVIRGADNFNFQSPTANDPLVVPRILVQYQQLPPGVSH